MAYERESQAGRDPGRRRGRVQPARRRGRRSHLGEVAGTAQRPDRSDHRRTQRARDQAHRGWGAGRVPQRGGRRALRHRGAERHGRAQCRRAAGPSHRVPDRHSSGRRSRGKRRRPDGRWRQHRLASGGGRGARRHLPVRGCLSPGQGEARPLGQRSRQHPTQEHRRAYPGLFAAGRHRRSGKGKRRPRNFRPLWLRQRRRRSSRSPSCPSPT